MSSVIHGTHRLQDLLPDRQLRRRQPVNPVVVAAERHPELVEVGVEQPWAEARAQRATSRTHDDTGRRRCHAPGEQDRAVGRGDRRPEQQQPGQPEQQPGQPGQQQAQQPGQQPRHR